MGIEWTGEQGPSELMIGLLKSHSIKEKDPPLFGLKPVEKPANACFCVGSKCANYKQCVGKD